MCLTFFLPVNLLLNRIVKAGEYQNFVHNMRIVDSEVKVIIWYSKLYILWQYLVQKIIAV